MREKKFFGMIIAKEYGGLGFSAHGHSQVVMKIASRSGSGAVTVRACASWYVQAR
jgi:alkylation response protein AidB-like acyl-CoA dehydrogenase